MAEAHQGNSKTLGYVNPLNTLLLSQLFPLLYANLQTITGLINDLSKKEYTFHDS